MYHIHKAEDGRYYYTVRDPDNGEVLATSETFERKRNACKGIAALIEAAKDERIVDHTTKKRTKSPGE